MRHPRKAAVTLATLGTVIGLAGCAVEPTVLPDVVVEHEGSAALDDDRFVVALRALQLAEAMAWNSGDFTIAPLVEVSTWDNVDDEADRYFAYTFRGGAPEAYIGPSIWSPISVETTLEGVEITACVADQDRSITTSDDESGYDLSTGRIVVYVVTVALDGRVELAHGMGTEEPCDPSSAEVLRFDPAPTPADEVTEADVRKPAPESDTLSKASETRAQLDPLVDGAQELIGGEWDFGDSEPEACTRRVLPGDGSGELSTILRTGPGVALDDQQAVIDAVVASWQQPGVLAEVTIEPSVPGPPVATVRYPARERVALDGFYIELHISEFQTMITAETDCRERS